MYPRYEDVKNDKTPTTWALFDYVPKTNKLKLVGSGTGGIDEMQEELTEGTPAYGIQAMLLSTVY